MPIQITEKNWLNYLRALEKINEGAAEKVTDYLSEHEILSEEGRKNFLDYFYAIVTKYGEGSAEMACQMYDATAKAQGANVPPAEPAPTATYPETARAVNGSLFDSPSGAKLPGTAKRLVKQAGVDTTMKNAIRDGAEWAWVPHGDTCAFCLMLASNGWQRASKKALKNGHAQHIHGNCDCTYATRHDGKSGVKGYDPDKYKAMYDNAEGDRWQDKLNSMRRDLYAENKDRINEQKREAYANHVVEHKMLRLAKQGNTFCSRMDPLFEYAKRITPIDEYEDIVGHGDPISMVFQDADGVESNVSAEEFANILERGGIYKGGKIRLIACQTGAGEGIVPTYLAKRFNTEVLAPTETVNVDFLGNIILADDEKNAKMGIETGRWVRFGPNGRIE